MDGITVYPLGFNRGTWAARVSNGEDGVLNVRRVFPLDLEEGELVRKSFYIEDGVLD